MRPGRGAAVLLPAPLALAPSPALTQGTALPPFLKLRVSKHPAVATGDAGPRRRELPVANMLIRFPQ